MAYDITFEENPSPEQIQILSDGITEHDRLKMGARDMITLTYLLRDESGAIVGGVHGNYSRFGWLYISTLWVSENVRSGGYGSKLMKQIEDEAIKRGCANAYLDTFSFQALEFYKKLGYTVFGMLEDFPKGHQRCFLRKKLI
jgi:GNAT superfamily N-acetyltransferase